MENDMTRFTGRTAFVTGGTTGIGLATAQALLAEGAKVVITGQNAERVAQAAAQLGNDARGIVADVRSASSMRAAVAEAVAAFGAIDILFANAGVITMGPVEATPEDAIDAMIDINVKGVIHTVQAVVPQMRDGGAVVLNASNAGVRPMAGIGVYSATKAAVIALAKSMTAELAPRGIRVNTVSPGPTETPIASKTGLPPEVIEATFAGMIAKLPAQRMAQASEIAQAVLYLASDAASFVYGTDLVIDGGMVAA
jgi:NAD(P)-dependent dehydrogenase (short-subunit alcohol dehydrogenase family)